MYVVCCVYVCNCIHFLCVLLEPAMHDLRIVVSKVSAYWEDVAFGLRYEISTVEYIKNTYNGDCKKCCKHLFKDWLTTNNGCKPKTWQTLLNTLEELDDLESVTEEIKARIAHLN